ncbi:MAG: PQQ-binding-like beta-propeller repeat protein, partial [Candidatus Latescibacterota bacterium]|nr:PQQ-binding-like beta-propeller repeat protein [Candidatus Latescibacterota bacterium]
TSGMTANSIPSPVVADGVAYFLSGFRGANLLAIRLADAKGELAADSKAILWTHDRDTPYVPSPLVYGDALYFVKGNKGILSCLNATSGDANYGPIRLEGIEGVYASPIGAADRVYIAGRNGAVQVLRHGAKYELLALNQLEDSFDASPVAVDGELFLRGQHLYCLAQD